MQSEQVREWTDKIIGYFGRDYEIDLINDIARFLKAYSDDEISKIYDRLKREVKKTFKIDIKALYDAAESLGILRGGASKDFGYLLRWDFVQCEACGNRFRFNRFMPFDNDSPDEASCSCLVCGWNQNETVKWREAGSPGADEIGTMGPNYFKELNRFRETLADRKEKLFDAHRNGIIKKGFHHDAE
jgi:hypothetical protein